MLFEPPKRPALPARGPARARARAVALSLALGRLAGRAVAAGLVASLVSTTARADDAKKHEIAVYVEGTKATEVREKILSILPAGAHVVDAAEFRQLLQKAGQKVPVGVPLTMSQKRKPILAKFGKATSGASAEAAIIGVVKARRAGGQEVLLLWLNADESEPTVDSTVPLDGSEKDALAKALETELAPMKSATEPSATPDKTPTTEPGPAKDKKSEPDEPSDDSPRPKNTHGKQIVDLFAAFDMGGRFFSYHQPITSNLRDYSVFGAPGFAIAAEVFPMAMLKTPVIQGLGIVADFRMALGLGSKTKDGTKVDTGWNRFDVGLHYRQPLAKLAKKGDKAVVLGLKGTFGRDSFSLTTKDATLAQETPAATYLFLRAGLDGEFPAGPIFLTLRGGYLGAFSAGEVQKRFKDQATQDGPGRAPSLGGVDLGGGVTVPIASGFEIRFTGEYVRWFYAFKPKPGDAYIAGGALDQNVHLELGPAYVF